MDEIPFDESALELDDWGKLFSPSGTTPRANARNLINNNDDNDHDGVGSELDQSHNPLETSYSFWESIQSESPHKRMKLADTHTNLPSINANSNRNAAMIDNRNLALLKKLHNPNTSKLMSALSGSKLDLVLSMLGRNGAGTGAATGSGPSNSSSSSSSSRSSSSRTGGTDDSTYLAQTVPKTSTQTQVQTQVTTASPSPGGASLRDRRQMSGIDISVTSLLAPPPTPTPAVVGSTGGSCEVGSGTTHTQLSPDTRSFFESLHSVRGSEGHLDQSSAPLGPGRSFADERPTTGINAEHSRSTSNIHSHVGGQKTPVCDSDPDDESDEDMFHGADITLVPCTPREYQDQRTPSAGDGGLNLPTKRKRLRYSDTVSVAVAAIPVANSMTSADDGAERVASGSDQQTAETDPPTRVDGGDVTNQVDSRAEDTPSAEPVEPVVPLQENAFVHFFGEAPGAVSVLPSLLLPALRMPAPLDSVLSLSGPSSDMMRATAVTTTTSVAITAEAKEDCDVDIAQRKNGVPVPVHVPAKCPKLGVVERTCAAIIKSFGGNHDPSEYLASRDSLGVRGVAVECVHCGHNAVTLAKSLDLDLRRVYDVLKIMDLLGFIQQGVNVQEAPAAAKSKYVKKPKLQFEWSADSGLVRGRLLHLLYNAISKHNSDYQLPLFEQGPTSFSITERLQNIYNCARMIEHDPPEPERKSIEHYTKAVMQLFLMGHDHLTVRNITQLMQQYDMVGDDTSAGDSSSSSSSSGTMDRRISDAATICAGLGFLEKYEATSRHLDDEGNRINHHICMRRDTPNTENEMESGQFLNSSIQEGLVSRVIVADDNTKYIPPNKKKRTLNFMAYFRWKVRSVNSLLSECTGTNQVSELTPK